MSLVKFTQDGVITVECRAFEEPEGLRNVGNVAVEIIVSDTGCGISSDKLESIFREFEQVEMIPPLPPPPQPKGLGMKSLRSVWLSTRLRICCVGLGLAVVARIVEQLGGQLRVDSKVDEGSRFSFLIPFGTELDGNSSPSSQRSRTRSNSSRGNEIESLVSALQAHPMTGSPTQWARRSASSLDRPLSSLSSGGGAASRVAAPSDIPKKPSRAKIKSGTPDSGSAPQLRILIVEVCLFVLSCA